MNLSLQVKESDNRRILNHDVGKNIIMDGKAKRNAEYLAVIDRGIKQMKEGTGRFFSDAELEAFINGDGV